MLKVAILLADIFSLGKLQLPDNLLKRFENPNPFQTQSQFLWDFMFWQVLGNSICIAQSKVLESEENIYWLDLSKIEVPQKTQDKLDKFYLSKQSYNELLDSVIKYRFNDRTEKEYKIKELIAISDTSNGRNWLLGFSRLDALYKVITNSNIGLEAKKDNLDFSRKFLVNGKNSIEDTTELPLNEREKSDIESKLLGNRKIHAVKSPIEIKRFTDNIKALALDESYMNDLHIIGNMYNVPKDVIEAIGKGTWDNQRVARAVLTEMSLQSKGEALIRSFAKHYRIEFNHETMYISWSHLSFNQAFEKERAETNQLKVNAMQTLVNMGADPNDVARDFGFDYKFKKQTNV
jgi:hypothetical protein